MKAKCFALTIVTVASMFAARAAEVTGKITTPGSARGLAGAIVYVVSGVQSGTTAPQRPQPTFVVREGRLDPQLLVVQTDQPLVVTNADDGGYNVHFLFRESGTRNHGLPPGQSITVRAARPELFARVSEDLRRLDGYICVVEHPYYAVTDASGAFKITDLPPGTYTIEAAHPREGRINREVTVGGASSTADFALPGRSRPVKQ